MREYAQAHQLRRQPSPPNNHLACILAPATNQAPCRAHPRKPRPSPGGCQSSPPRLPFRHEALNVRHHHIHQLKPDGWQATHLYYAVILSNACDGALRCDGGGLQPRLWEQRPPSPLPPKPWDGRTMRIFHKLGSSCTLYKLCRRTGTDHPLPADNRRPMMPILFWPHVELYPEKIT
ncbi:hypothetical protein GWK47_025657 [Chionoecetes opilio]|uniref:Uncharacterized protein n=1 Tax=Chionoecetes opilio TaxID=41210 RepID=A0A8J8WFI7_CHIOP|nr:hypothetical protein GWK47_025657 [Chionoecetes opilio]